MCVCELNLEDTSDKIDLHAAGVNVIDMLRTVNLHFPSFAENSGFPNAIFNEII